MALLVDPPDLNRTMHLPPLLALPLLLAVSGLAIAQQPLNVNLLQNPDFETGVGGWTTSRGAFTAKPYGIANAPSIPAGATINGGNQFVECTTAYEPCGGCWRYGVMEQIINVTGNSVDIDNGNLFLELSGFFGGGSGVNDYTYLRASYFNGTGGALSVPFVDPSLQAISGTNRNYEPILMGVKKAFPIPALTRTIKIELLAYAGASGNGTTWAWADNLEARLLLSPSAPPLPLGVNLMDVSTMEGPMLLHPQVFNGCRVTRGGFRQRLYGSANAPSQGTAVALNGGSSFLECATAYEPCGGCWRYGVMEQVLDVTGNANDIDSGSLYIELAGCLGGGSGLNDYTFLRATYFNSTGGTLTVPFVDPTLPAVGGQHRNYEPILLSASESFPIPPLTRTIKVELYAYAGASGNGATNAWADNLSARLIPASGRYTPQTGANLIDNGTFESAAILNPAAARGWRVQRGTFQAQPYGLPNLPTPAVASTIGGGTYLARPTAVTSGSAAMTQTFELNNLETMVDTSQLSVRIEGHLGGIGSSGDNCYIRTYYYSQYGAQLGVDQVGPVTAAQRNNVTTLLLRQDTFLLPVGTRKLVVEANFAGVNGLLDNLRASLVPSGVARLFPGTGDDLDLGTGINGVTSGGPGRDVKFALPNDIVTIQVRSPQGAFHWMPLMLAGTVFGNSATVPSLGLPALHVNPFVSGGFFLLDGVTSIGPFNRPLVLPTGTDVQLAVPPGLAGYRVRLQALVLAVTAGNGLYATTDAHEIRFQ